MRHVRLKVKEDLALGEFGLIVDGMKLIDTPMVSNEGFMIAHDLLEHQNGIRAIGSVGDEVEAMGGCWFIRGQLGQIRRGMTIHSPEHNIATDIANLAEIYCRNVPMRAEIFNTHEHGHDAAFDEIISQARSRCLDYLDEDSERALLLKFCRDAKHLLRTGYRKAARRFKDDYHLASDQFWSIADAVDGCIKHGVYEYQEFRLSYGNGRATCEEIHDDYGY